MKLVVNNFQNINESVRPGREYDFWTVKKLNYIASISKSDSKYFDLITEYDLNKDESYYLVYVTYETGDSFGSSKGNIEYIHLFKDENLAFDLCRKIQNEEKEFTRIDFINDAGDKIHTHNNLWSGYFEELESVDVKEVIFI